jgi:hypothetical protein
MSVCLEAFRAEVIAVCLCLIALCTGRGERERDDEEEGSCLVYNLKYKNIAMTIT